MMDWDWRTVAAVWGAALSTWLAVTKLLPDRPRFYVEPDPSRIIDRDSPADAVLRIVNPAKRMVFLQLWACLSLPPRGGDGSLVVHMRGDMRNGVERRLRLAVPGETVIKADIVWGHEGRWLLVFLWEHTWLLPVPLPSFAVVSTRQLTGFRPIPASSNSTSDR